MIRNAVTCDRADCLALYVEPLANPYARPGLDGEPTRAEDVLDFDQLVELVGWAAEEKAGHTCPGCAAGRGPVLDRGECPTCTGATVDLPAGETCHYCRTVTPHADDLDDALWDGRGIQLTDDGPVAGGDDWS